MLPDSKSIKIFQAIDQINGEDPNTEVWQGSHQPSALLYAQRITHQLNNYFPEASDALHIAARAHHIGRWQISRASYPSGKAGYHQWRNDLAEYHAKTTEDLLKKEGYSSLFIEKVKGMIGKKNLRSDYDTQILEDVICHVFLQYYFESFAEKHAEDKVIHILQRTWKKMSRTGQKTVTELALTPPVMAYLGKATLL